MRGGGEKCVIWGPFFKEDITAIEKVQRRATKVVPELKDHPYETRQRALKLPSLLHRRRRGDMIYTYTIITDKMNFHKEDFFQISHLWTLGHQFKIANWINTGGINYTTHLFEIKLCNLESVPTGWPYFYRNTFIIIIINNNPSYYDALRLLTHPQYHLDAYLLLCQVYSTAVATPISSSTAERSFSVSKRVKSRLRSIMLQERLESPLFIAIEKKILLSLDIEITIDTFGRSSLELSRTLMFWKHFQ